MKIAFLVKQASLPLQTNTQTTKPDGLDFTWNLLKEQEATKA